MPPGEFPIQANYSIVKDEQAFGIFYSSGWVRDWSSANIPPSFISPTPDYWYARVMVFVYPDRFAREAIASELCNWTFQTPVTKSEISAQVIGDGAKACRYVFQQGSSASWTTYITGTRNVEVVVGVEPRRLTDTDALNLSVSLARQQLAIINRVSPP